MEKIKLCGLFILGGLLCLMPSCLSIDNDNINDWEASNAQIAKISLACDSIPGLEDVKFTIDQVNGKIFNKDSMPFGTHIGHKVIATFEYDAIYSISGLMIIEASGDTVGVTKNSEGNTTDSIDFSAPVSITVYAYDGLTTKTYEAQLNVHQVDPYLMTWEKYSDLIPGRTFRDMKALQYNDYYYMYVLENTTYRAFRTKTNDLSFWEEIPLSGFPARAILTQLTEFDTELVVLTETGVLYRSDDGREWAPVDLDMSISSLLGYLPESTVTGRAGMLCGIAKQEDGLVFCAIDKQNNYTSGKAVPEGFPITGFGQFHYETMYYPRLVIAAGRDSKNIMSDKSWGTMDGVSWTLLTNPITPFLLREGAAFTYYNNLFFIFGGIGYNGLGLKDIYFSTDQGISWIDKLYYLNEDYDETDSESEKYVLKNVYNMPDEYLSRGYSSVIVDKDNYILLFGGKAREDTNVLNELWRGRINWMGFEDNN